MIYYILHVCVRARARRGGGGGGAPASVASAARVFVGGVVAAVGLGATTSWAAYRYLDTSGPGSSSGAAGGAPAEGELGVPTWPLWLACGATFSIGSACGVGYGMRWVRQPLPRPRYS
jgi:hypothetical protein